MNKDIAIIGIAGIFPMANDLDELFENLKYGRDCVRDISPQRVRDTTLPESRSFRKCGYIDDIDKFDYRFFGISLAEAKLMCPEQRILLEITHASLENAGYSPGSLSGSNTAVFVSTAFSGYYQHASERSHTLLTGNSPEFLAAKIGRHFNLKGNVAVIDTTCSSSLVAIHMACNEMITGDASMAMVAGVNLFLFPYSDEPGGLDTEAPGGKSKAFSAAADGMSYGEVAVAILLKPLEKAYEDKDNIHAIIKGTAVNYNGSASSSITAPDSVSQSEVLVKAWKKAGIKATDISYIEAHGSGTQLGDSLEFEALNLAFKEVTTAKHICPISTIKSNTGHGRYLSGMAGLSKTVLSLKKRVLFPTIHFDVPNPLLDYANSAVYVNKDYCSWESAGDKPRYAGVTSLGWSGTNCHVVLAEYIEDPGAFEKTRGTEPLDSFHIPISGKTSWSCKENAVALLKYLKKNDTVSLENLSYTLAAGRDHYDYRLSYIVSSVAELTSLLSECTNADEPVHKIRSGSLIFLFSESAHLSTETVDKFKKYNAFHKTWNECECFRPINEKYLIDFAFQYSLYSLLSENNIVSDHLLAIGLGKILTMVISDEISLEAGLKLASEYQPELVVNIEERVKNLLNKLTPEGSCTFLDMAADGLLRESLLEYNSLNDKVYYTGINTINACTNSLVFIQHILYSRIHSSTANYPYKFLPDGKRIELPGYRFERTRCWIRDTPAVTNALSEQAPVAKTVVEEKLGYIESKLAEIFLDLLKVSRLSVSDNFFYVGGDSLKATKAILTINNFFHVSLSFEDIFDFPSVLLLSAYLKKQLATSRKIILIWEVVLQNNNIGEEDDFFELGGHSLMATQMIMMLNNECEVELNFEDVFSHSSVKKLAAHIESSKVDESSQVVKHQIVAASNQESYPLTYSQKRMWFLNYFMGNSGTYNNVFGIRLEGDLDYAIFDKTFLLVVQRQEALRTVFRLNRDEPRQFVLNMDVINFKTEVLDMNDSAVLELLLGVESKFIFDITSFPLFRSKLFKEANGNHIYILNIHHIISDGWSMGVFLQDFYMFYEQLRYNKTPTAQQLAIQIKDYAVWQYQEDFQAILGQQESYWLNRFKDSIPVLSLPTDHKRPAIQSFEGDAVSFNIELQQVEGLRKIGKRANATLYMVLLAVYNILLGKLSNSEDVVVGSPIAGRRFDGLQSLVGLFMNTIVLRNAPLLSLSFNEFLADVKQKTLDVFNNQDYPYEELVKKLLIERDTGRNPLFDAMLILHNNKIVGEHFSEIKISPLPFVTKTARVDLLMEALETDDGLSIQFEYSTALFKRETILKFVDCFRKILTAVVADANKKIGDLEIISSEEKHRVLYGFNNTTFDFALNKAIGDVFEERVSERNEAVALVFEDREISYTELNVKSDYLAARILGSGIKSESIIGIMMQRSPEIIVSIMAVLKAGCTYLPIDPEYPTERINYMLQDSEPSALLIDESMLNFCCNLEERMVIMNVKSDEVLPRSFKKSDKGVQGSTLAYLIYTSGSTGRPKGVMISHNNVLNFVYSLKDKIGIKPENTILCLTTISFDIFVAETILPLLAGAKIVLAGSNVVHNPVALAHLIGSQKVDLLQITPSHLKLLLSGTNPVNPLDGIKVLMVGGEAFPNDLLVELKKTYKGRIFNMYGPTETTVWSTIADLTNSESINIGKPIANTTVRLLDTSANLQPIGIAGELCIGGAGVAKGYWKNEEMTAVKFCNDPYLESEIIYRTGDWARWLPDGSIEYIGRIDCQVKIRGFRVELGEIENCLKKSELILDAVVVPVEKAGDKYLVGYYVSTDEIPLTKLKSHLSAELPNFMIPSFFLRVDAMPLTPNGKIDRKALPHPHFKLIVGRTMPSGEIEKKLSEIWENVLNLEKDTIGNEDDFFVSGGHSILAIRLIHNIQQAFTVDVTLREIFEHATIEKQAQLIKRNGSKSLQLIPKAGKRNFYPASSSQEGLFYEYMLDSSNLSYNVFSTYLIKNSLDIDKIARTFLALIQRHESLRTYFELENGNLIQRIKDDIDFKIEVINAGRQTNIGEIFTEFVRPFNLSVTPLIRCTILQHEELGNFLFVDIHHIVCDGISLNHLMNEFRHVYRGGELKQPDLRYVDYACWQKEQQNDLKKQREFWLRNLGGTLSEIDLPTKQERTYTTAYEVSQSTLEINKHTFGRIKEFAASKGSSPFMVLLSVYYILLSKVSGKQDLIVGTDAAGRSQAGLGDIVGVFINVLPLRIKIRDEGSYSDLLDDVRGCVLEAFENQDLQFDEIVAQLQGFDKSQRNKIVEVHFSYVNYLDNTENDMDFEGYTFPDRKMNSPYEFKLQVNDRENSLQIAFVYSIDLYENETIELFKKYYFNILVSVLENSSVEVGNIELDRPLVFSSVDVYS